MSRDDDNRDRLYDEFFQLRILKLAKRMIEREIRRIERKNKIKTVKEKRHV